MNVHMRMPKGVLFLVLYYFKIIFSEIINYLMTLIKSYIIGWFSFIIPTFWNSGLSNVLITEKMIKKKVLTKKKVLIFFLPLMFSDNTLCCSETGIKVVWNDWYWSLTKPNSRYLLLLYMVLKPFWAAFWSCINEMSHTQGLSKIKPVMGN